MTNITVTQLGKVAVLYGGASAEREVSLNSGQAVYDALIASGVDAHLLDTKGNPQVMALKEAGFERAFIALHGRGGEDGQMQAILDWQGVPYTGSGVLACALAMDKVLTKRLWAAFGLPVSSEVVINEQSTYAELVEKLGSELIAIKPALEGSSVGVSCVDSEQGLISAIEKAGGRNEKIMAEPWILGRELSCAIVGDNVLPAIEIRASNAHQFYDYDAKYLADDTDYICPAPIDEALADELATLTKQAFQAVSGAGWGRIDFMLDKSDRPWLLEVNMAPGMTSHSLVPLAAKTQGISFEQLILTILAQTNTKSAAT